MRKRTTFPCPYCKGRHGKIYWYDGIPVEQEYCGFCKSGQITIGGDLHKKIVVNRLYRVLFDTFWDESKTLLPSMGENIRDLLGKAVSQFTDDSYWSDEDFCRVCEKEIPKVSLLHPYCSIECENTDRNEHRTTYAENKKT